MTRTLHIVSQSAPQSRMVDPWLDPALRAKFDGNIEFEPNSGCWLWSPAHSNFGYGIFGVSRVKRTKTNVADMIAKGRFRQGNCFGAARPRAKISGVKDIFDLRKAGLLHREIAEKVGLSQTQVRDILQGRRWAKDPYSLLARAQP